MKTICAWCKAIITDGPENPVSHGICEACDEKNFPATAPEPSRAVLHVIYSGGEFDREMLEQAHALVSEAIYSADPCRINRIAEILEIDPQRCRRMIDALGLSADYLAAKEAGRGARNARHGAPVGAGGTSGDKT